MDDQYKELWKTLTSFLKYFSSVVIFLLIIVSIIIFLPDNDLVGRQNHHLLFRMINIHAISVVILTAVLICVGWLQLTKLNNISKADFLLRIDNRYGSSEIIKARAIIQRIFRKAYPAKAVITEEIYIKKMVNEINELRKKDDDVSCNEVSYLLNLLDFLETIAYFSRKEYISVKEIDELLGNSLIFYFKIFKPWIYERRLKYNNKSYYSELENLIEKIDAIQVKDRLEKI
jgi:hypothetical protein